MMSAIGVLSRQDPADVIASLVTPLGYRPLRLRAGHDLRPIFDRRDVVAVIVDTDGWPEGDPELDRLFELIARAPVDVVTGAPVPVVFISARSDPASIRRAFHVGARDYLIRPIHQREHILRLNAALRRRARIACIGGGSGLFAVLSAIRPLPDVLPISIVTMADDGGSSGSLRAGFGILPPGDVRMSLVALSDAPTLMNHVMQYRFARDSMLGGHTVGNLILAALSELTGSMPAAVKALGDILHVQGIVLCASPTDTTLVAEYADGRVVRGQSNITNCVDRPAELPVRRLRHDPAPACSPDAYAAILAADVVVIGPGDLYTSVVANLAIEGLRDALAHTRARRVYICNLMTKPGETSGMDAPRHVAEVLAYLGGDHLDYVITSSTSYSPHALDEYARQQQHPVRPGDPAEMTRLTRARHLHVDVGHESDLVRHDGAKLRQHLAPIIR